MTSIGCFGFLRVKFLMVSVWPELMDGHMLIFMHVDAICLSLLHA
jgi:hypothetical protein